MLNRSNKPLGVTNINWLNQQTLLALVRSGVYILALGGAGLLARLALVFGSSFTPFIQLPLLLLFGHVVDPLVIAVLAVVLPTKPVLFPHLRPPLRTAAISALAVWAEMILGSGTVLLPSWVFFFSVPKSALAAALAYVMWHVRQRS